MAKTKKAVKRKTFIWHIFRFRERFELPDDVRYCRQSPLIYVREYVSSGMDDEAISYQQQKAILRTRANHLMLLGAFGVLREIAANRSRCYRGYLLDEKLKPAGDKKIAQWLVKDVKQTRMILKELAEVGLIEKVPLPEFDPSVNDPPAKLKPDQSRRSSKKKKKARRKKARVRRTPGRSGDAGNPLRAENAREGTTASGIEKKRKLNHPASAAPIPEGKGADADKGKPRLKLHRNTPDATRRADRTKHRRQTPAATPPTMPKESDAGVGQTGSSPCSPPRSANKRRCNEPEPIGTIIGRIERLYDPNCQEFAKEIYQAIGTPHQPDSPEGRRELGNFAAAWQEAQNAGLPPSELSRLWDKSVREAKQLNKKRRRVKFEKSAEAVWRWQFNARLESMKRHAATG